MASSGFTWASRDSSRGAAIRLDGATDRKRLAHQDGRIECNWAQVLEGVIDSAHSNFLHSSEIVPSSAAASLGGASIFRNSDERRQLDRPSNDGRPRMETQDTSYGFRYAAIRKPMRDADKNKDTA